MWLWLRRTLVRLWQDSAGMTSLRRRSSLNHVRFIQFSAVASRQFCKKFQTHAIEKHSLHTGKTFTRTDTEAKLDVIPFSSTCRSMELGFLPPT